MEKKRIHLIINPTAGRGRSARSLPHIIENLGGHGEYLTLAETTGPGHAKELAAEALGETDIIVVVGGDGTVREVASSVAGSEAHMGIIPLGSGNDFVKNLGIIADVEKACHTIRHGRIKAIDVGYYNDELFVNSIAMGIDGSVARSMNNARWLPPSLAYHYGVLQNVFFYKNRTINWSTENESGTLKAVLTAVMNGHTYGGSYHIAPPAKVDDGLLDLVVLGNFGVLSRIRHIPKVKTGKHLSIPDTYHITGKTITISTDEPIPVALDGDLLPDTKEGISATIRISPGGLKMLVPQE